MQTIKIDGLSQEKAKFGIKTTITSGKNKYYFYDTKKAGGNTKAWEQMNQYGFKVGQEVQAEVKEEQKTFINAENKSITYTDRKIIYFGEVENTPLVKNIDIEEDGIKAEDLPF